VLSLKRGNSPKGLDPNGARQPLSIILPLFRESRILGSTLSHYLPLLGKGIDRIVLLLSVQDDDTKVAVDTWRANNAEHCRSLLTVVCPNSCNSKSTKLQYFWETLGLRKTESWQDMLFCVFDADARPSPDFFQSLHSVSVRQSESAHVYQALPVAVPCSNKLLPDSLALAQSERSVIECWALDRWSGKQDRPMLLGLMGAAMAFNGSAVKALAPWPAYSDDIQIGYRSDLLRIARTFIPVRVTVQGTNSFKDWWFQQLRIAEGVQSRLRECSAAGLTGSSKLGTALLSACFDWTPGWRLLVAFVAICCALPDYPLLALGIIATQTFVQLFCFYSVNPGCKVHSSVRLGILAFLGALMWSPLRTCAGLIALVSVVPALRRVMDAALNGRSSKQ
jgi:cellulose synthase/poly-beta-1,6-N-acetylglucosamine synthase-like glycosyltransferase